MFSDRLIDLFSDLLDLAIDAEDAGESVLSGRILDAVATLSNAI